MRRLRDVFVGPITASPFTAVRVCTTLSCAASRSRSRQRSPRTSPRRMPVVATTHERASRSAHRGSAVKNSRRSSDDHVANSRLDELGGRAAAAALRWTRPSRSASASALRKTTWLLRTVLADNGLTSVSSLAQQVGVEALDLQRGQRLHRHLAQPRVDAGDGQLVAVHGRRPEAVVLADEPVVEDTDSS